MRTIFYIFSLIVILTSCATKKANPKELFAKENLLPWSIVAFDSQERSPVERVDMIKELGYDQYAFGGRKQHFKTMANEIRYARSQQIDIPVVWLYITPFDKPGKLREEAELIFKALEETRHSCELWVGISPKVFNDMNDEEAFVKANSLIEYISKRAAAVNCTIALYNHGGWYGKPKNQLAILKSLPNESIKMVYNFHHAHEELDNYKENMKLMLPYLSCVNLNGMQKDGPKIMTVGSGDLEKEMISYLLDIGYRGRFGMLGHVKGGDAKVLLEQNYAGLKSLF